MTKLSATYSADIAAPQAQVYAIFADYRDAHLRVLPRDFFKSIEIESGGRGEGTVVRVVSRVLGAEQKMRLTVAEPEPGRVLTESDLDMGLVTSFTIDALGDKTCRVTLATIWSPQKGIAGWLERRLMPRILRNVFRKELGLLADLCRERGYG